MEPRILFAKVRRVKQYSGLIFGTGVFVPSFVSNKPGGDSGPSGFCSSGRRGRQGIIRPGVPRIASFHVFFDVGVAARPKTGQILRDGDRLLARRQHMDEDTVAALVDRRRAASPNSSCSFTASTGGAPSAE